MIAENTTTPTVLVWFRKDLRLQDNPSLHAAVLSGCKVLPVFIWDPEEGGQWSPGPLPDGGSIKH